MADLTQEEQQPVAKQATIIIATRNRAVELEAALDAIQAASRREALEVIVMDNGSTDNTQSLREKYGESVNFLKLPKNFGWVKAVNIALRSAQGEFILFSDPAVRYEKDAIAQLIDVLAASPEATAAVPQLVSESGQLATVTRELPAPGNLKPPFRQPATSETSLVCPGFQSFLVRKTFLKGMNYLDQRFGDSWADAEICFQIRNAGKKILWAQQAKATLGTGLPLPEADSLVEADYIQGAATYQSKHWGFVKAAVYRLLAILGALVTLKFSLFFDLINGQKIDGSHA